MDFMNTLAKTLQIARKNAGLSQNDVAELLHITRQSISQWENGHSCPDLQNLQSLSNIYHMSLDELLGGHPSPVACSCQLSQVQLIPSFSFFDGKFLLFSFILLLTFYMPFIGIIFALIGLVTFYLQKDFPYYILFIPTLALALSIMYTVLFLLEVF